MTPNADAELVGALPREVGILLIAAGVGGILLPGPIGSPFLLLGAVTLSPRLFSKLEARFRQAVPAHAPSRAPGRSSASSPTWRGAIPAAA